MGKRWTSADIAKLPAGMVKGGSVRKSAGSVPGSAKSVRKSAQNVPKLPADEPTGLQHIKGVLDRLAIAYDTEYRFHPVRRFRFDVAIQALKVAVEYEGLMSAKSRHTTVSGYTRDATKYNLAQLAGWRVMRYTAANYRDFENDLQKIIINP